MLAEEIMAALPTIVELYEQGWTVKPHFNANQSEEAPDPFLVTLWKPGMGRGVQAGGQTLVEALSNVQHKTLAKMTRRVERDRRQR